MDEINNIRPIIFFIVFLFGIFVFNFFFYANLVEYNFFTPFFVQDGLGNVSLLLKL